MIRPLVLLALTPLLAAQEPPATATPRPAVTVEQILSVPEPGRFRNLFQQFRTEHVALSPDGHHVALSVREGTAIYVLVLDWTQPEKIKARVRVVDDEAATYRLAFGQREDNPGQIQWMRWVTANRIVVGTNESFPRGTGAIFAFDADGKNARRLADPNDLMTPPPLGDGFASFANRPFARTPDMSDAEVAEAEAAASAVLGLRHRNRRPRMR